MRYLGQKDDYNCGPIAVINALNYFEYGIDESYIPAIGKKCGTNPKDGTRMRPIIKYLRYRGLNVFEKRKINLDKVIDGLDSGIWILFGKGFGITKKDYHWFVMTDYNNEDKTAKLINYYSDRPVMWVEFTELRKTLMSPAIYIHK